MCGVVEEIKEIYDSIKEEIISRLEELKANQQEEGKVFKELVFCLLTPQSKARVCWHAVEMLDKEGLLTQGKEEDIKKRLKGVRFKNNKARYILEARKIFINKGKIEIKDKVLNPSPFEAREWLVKHVKGMGYKEASHFLRNIGRGQDIAILDRHILKNLKHYRIIDEIPKTLTKKRYLAIESKMREFAQRIGIPLSHLDFVFWYKEAGEVFK